MSGGFFVVLPGQARLNPVRQWKNHLGACARRFVCLSAPAASGTRIAQAQRSGILRYPPIITATEEILLGFSFQLFLDYQGCEAVPFTGNVSGLGVGSAPAEAVKIQRTANLKLKTLEAVARFQA